MGDSPPQSQPESQSSTSEGGGVVWDAAALAKETTDSALRSARSLQHRSSSFFTSFQEFVPQMKSEFRTYEDFFFKKVKDELMSAKEHPALVGGVAVTAALLLLRGPRRFLFRQTLGRFQSEEAQFIRVEKNVNELRLSVDLMKKESAKLLERASLAEKDMSRGCAELMGAGREIRRLAKLVHKAELQAADLMDGLREISGREPLKLRAEVATMTSVVKQQRSSVDKRIAKISELGVPV